MLSPGTSEETRLRTETEICGVRFQRARHVVNVPHVQKTTVITAPVLIAPIKLRQQSISQAGQAVCGPDARASSRPLDGPVVGRSGPSATGRCFRWDAPVGMRVAERRRLRSSVAPPTEIHCVNAAMPSQVDYAHHSAVMISHERDQQCVALPATCLFGSQFATILKPHMHKMRLHHGACP